MRMTVWSDGGPTANVILFVILMVQKQTAGSGQTNKVVTFKCEVRASESFHRRSSSSLGNYLLVVMHFAKNDVHFLVIDKENEKINDTMPDLRTGQNWTFTETDHNTVLFLLTSHYRTRSQHTTIFPKIGHICKFRTTEFRSLFLLFFCTDC